MCDLTGTRLRFVQVTCDQKAEKRETTEETTRQWEPLTEDELKLLGRLHGVRRLLKRTVHACICIKARRLRACVYVREIFVTNICTLVC